MGDKKRKASDKKSGRVLDFFVILLCLSGVAVSLYLFQQDLFRTLRAMSIQPAGTVKVRYNTVQRRLSDRVVWDRLFTESPVYPGDLIRIARLSGAVLDIDSNYIELGENTLIRIQKYANLSQIELFSGDLTVNYNIGGGNLAVAIGNSIVEASPGAVVSASVGEKGTVVSVPQGAAQLKQQDGQVQNISAGTAVRQNNEGQLLLEPMVVTSPKPNARLLKSASRLLPVTFSWNKANLENSDILLLEIAEDRNFAKIVESKETLGLSEVIMMDAGSWYWRISYKEDILNILSAGRVIVTEASPPSLVSP